MTPYGPPRTGMPLPGMMLVRAEAPAVRIGDAERDQAAAALGEHYAAGRLSQEEFDERSDRALVARVQQDLEPLFADLPVSETPRPRPQVRPVWPAMLVSMPVLMLIAVVAAVLLNSPWVVWGVFWVFLFSGFAGRRRYRPGHGPWR